MDPVTTIPPDASWQQLIYALFMLALPALFTYLERLRRDIKDNTEKTEKVNHSLNGELDERLHKLAADILTDIRKTISGETQSINQGLNTELDKRLARLAHDIKKDIGEAIAESHTELERRITGMDDRIAKLEERIFRQQ
jgi:ABC-type phosphate transport system auxiliary subunit